MRPIVLYEPRYCDRFYPLTDFLPFWELRVGALSLHKRWCKTVGSRQLLLLPRPEFSEVASALAPDATIIGEKDIPNEAIFINAALLPLSGFDLAAELEADDNPYCRILAKGAFADLLSAVNFDLPVPREEQRFTILHRVWHLIDKSPLATVADARFFKDWGVSAGSAIIGDANVVHIAPSAKIHPFVVFDSSAGPIIVDEGAEIKPFTHLAGPAYVGRDTILLGGKIAASSFGSDCRIAGEVSDSTFCDCVNKAHHGFIGHAYVGPFANFGAMTTNSNLKNTYGNVKLDGPSGAMDTGLMKLGFVCGPHTKFGIGSLISTGSTFGGFCNLFAGGNFLPKHVESFSWFDGDEMVSYRFDSAVKVAVKVCERRHRVFSAAETRKALSVYRKVYRPPAK